MPTSTFEIKSGGSIAGVNTRGQVSRSGSTPIGIDEVLTPAKVGSLTTRTDDNTGVATMVAGHGFITGNVVDVFWSGGMRYGMTATVATNAVTVDGGAGDALPIATTALTVSKPLTLDSITFVPEDLWMIAAATRGKCSIRFLATAAVVVNFTLGAEEAYCWAAGQGIVNPLISDPQADITSVVISNGSAESNRIRAGLLVA